MQPIALESIRQWSKDNWGLWVVKSASTNCPHCGELTTFPMQNFYNDTPRKTISMTGKCPACNIDVYFWEIEPALSQNPIPSCKMIAVYPEQKAHRKPLIGNELMSERLRAAYIDTLDVFNKSIWSATGTCCRRTLEGIIKELLPEDKRKGNLANQIRALKDSVDLAKPIVQLSDSMREGGNIGAHFDFERELDKTSAEAMVDLLEYLIEYVYLLPKMIAALENQLQNRKS